MVSENHTMFQQSSIQEPPVTTVSEHILKVMDTFSCFVVICLVQFRLLISCRSALLKQRLLHYCFSTCEIILKNMIKTNHVNKKGVK